MRAVVKIFRRFFHRLTGRPEQLELDLWSKKRR
jgi:hypothetical protein